VITNADYTWDIYFEDSGSTGIDPHSGSWCAQIPWDVDLEGQDEWLITPDRGALGDEPFEVNFWTIGSLTFAEAGAFTVRASCNDGATWSTLYQFPDSDENESWTWYENQIIVDCL
jgi:hypothetical protein